MTVPGVYSEAQGGYAQVMPDVRDVILDGLAEGRSLRAICREDGMPSPSTVVRWANDDASFAEQYARARSIGDEAMAEDIQDIADDSDSDPNDRRIRIDARKWLLAKRQPKKYGDKTLVGSDPDNPLPSSSINVSGLSEATLRELAAQGLK